MKSQVCLLLFAFFLVPALHGQDTLILNNGSELHIVVMEITDDSISYKMNDNNNKAIAGIDIGQVFMVIYHSGKRESFDRSVLHLVDKKVTESHSRSALNAYPAISLANNGFEVRHIESKKICRHRGKDSIITMSAIIDAYYNGQFFTRLIFNAYQHSGFIASSYSENRKGVLRKSSFSITAQSKIVDNILFEKYEKPEGRGFGWCLSPAFFSTSDISCSIKLLVEKDLDVKYYAGETVTLRLQDCSSVEKKILSASLLWLDTNFGNTNNVKNR